METVLMDGKAVADNILADLQLELDSLDSPPKLATIQVGDNPASSGYVSSKHKTCERIGIESERKDLPEATSRDELLDEIGRLSEDRGVHGILVQLPLPNHLSPYEAIRAIPPEKDVDGLHPYNIGRQVLGETTLQPCTPQGMIHLLNTYGIELESQEVVVVGRSDIVGRPFARMAEQRNAGVYQGHSRVRDLQEKTREADILVAAIGSPRYFTADYIKAGAVVLDVGTTRVSDSSRRGYHWEGDVDSSVRGKASYLSPVPGGVGPLTIAMLMKNTLLAYRMQK